MQMIDRKINWLKNLMNSRIYERPVKGSFIKLSDQPNNKQPDVWTIIRTVIKTFKRPIVQRTKQVMWPDRCFCARLSVYLPNQSANQRYNQLYV